MFAWNHKPNSPTNAAGFALFYAVVVVAVISSLGAVLSSLIVREADLSATARQSSRAFYSADAGIECAQYWDLQKGRFPRNNNPVSDINCAGETGISVNSSDNDGDSTYVYDFSIDNNNICAGTVRVTKLEGGGRIITRIESIGSDECGSGTRVQRALRTTY